ncbi:MAG: hypothetical protein MNPFHGCM_01792 [Gemmatimonadaceae bacterium]|nr:hypothetical protein [Gemmatimonadaceae bacterium]
MAYGPLSLILIVIAIGHPVVVSSAGQSELRLNAKIVGTPLRFTNGQTRIGTRIGVRLLWDLELGSDSSGTWNWGQTPLGLGIGVRLLWELESDPREPPGNSGNWSLTPGIPWDPWETDRSGHLSKRPLGPPWPRQCVEVAHDSHSHTPPVHVADTELP